MNYTKLLFGKGIFKEIESLSRKKLADEVFQLMVTLNPILFATAINKVQLRNVYGANAYNPKDFAIRSTIDRYAISLEKKGALGFMVMDEEEYIRDKQLQGMISYYRRYGISIKGSSYQRYYENSLRNVLNSIQFSPSYLSPGIQLADVCARAVFMHYSKGHSNRFHQLDDLWDRDSDRIYEPFMYPMRKHWT